MLPSSLISSSSSFITPSPSNSDKYGSSTTRSSYGSYRDDSAAGFFFGSTCITGLMCSVDGNSPNRYLR